MGEECVRVVEEHEVEEVPGGGFGDILSDLGPAIAGSIGLALGGNITPEKDYPSMFEPVHSSAPARAGRSRRLGRRGRDREPRGGGQNADPRPRRQGVDGRGGPGDRVDGVTARQRRPCHRPLTGGRGGRRSPGHDLER